MHRGGQRGKGELTLVAVEEEGLGRKGEGDRRRRCGGQREDELGDGDLGFFAAILGSAEVDGGGAVAFPCSCGYGGDRGDGGELLKLRTWRSVRKFRKQTNFQREKIGGSGRGEGMAAAIRRWGKKEGEDG